MVLGILVRGVDSIEECHFQLMAFRRSYTEVDMPDRIVRIEEALHFVAILVLLVPYFVVQPNLLTDPVDLLMANQDLCQCLVETKREDSYC